MSRLSGTQPGRVARVLSRPLTIVDAGCRGGFDAVCNALEPNVQIIGFEPDPAECRRLQIEHSGGYNLRVVPLGLGPVRKKAKLHVTSDPACSSLYPPDPALARKRPILAVTNQVATTEIDLVPLDDWIRQENVGPVDYIKVDTQGSDLGVLQGAERTLKDVRILKVEVEFNPIYQGQPLFADIDSYLRPKGFVLWRLENLAHYQLENGLSRYPSPGVQFFDSRAVEFVGEGGQLFWAEAFYVKHDLADPAEGASTEALVADACLAAASGFQDLARNAGARLIALGHMELGTIVQDLAVRPPPVAEAAPAG